MRNAAFSSKSRLEKPPRLQAFTESSVSANQARVPERLSATRVSETDKKRDSSDDVAVIYPARHADVKEEP
jgi:hypothetical protein